MNHQTNSISPIKAMRWKPIAAALTLAVSAGLLTGCNDAQAGGLLGGGIGALAGQAIGHSTTATLLGLGIGAGAGYIIGNESDKGHQQRYGHSDWHDDYYRHHDHSGGYYDY